MRTSGEKAVIDANVILRYLIRDNEALYVKAAGIIKAMAEGRLALLCDPVILSQVVWASATFYKIPRSQISEGLEQLLNADGFVVPNKGRYVTALRLFAGPVPHFGDACACAAAIEECDGRLLSFDRKLSGIAGISRRESIE